eukprot:gene19426-19843_t
MGYYRFLSGWQTGLNADRLVPRASNPCGIRREFNPTSSQLWLFALYEAGSLSGILRPLGFFLSIISSFTPAFARLVLKCVLKSRALWLGWRVSKGASHALSWWHQRWRHSVAG